MGQCSRDQRGRCFRIRCDISNIRHQGTLLSPTRPFKEGYSMSDGRTTVELLDDSSSSSVELLGSSNDGGNTLRCNEATSRLLIVNNTSCATAVLPSVGRQNDDAVNQNNGQPRLETLDFQSVASRDEASTEVRNKGNGKNCAICLSSDDSDILSVHTHVLLSSGDDRSREESEGISASGQKETIPTAEVEIVKMGPRKTPFLGTLPGSIAIAGTKRGQKCSDNKSPPTKRARSATGFDHFGAPLGQICFRTFRRETISDHEAICGNRPLEAPTNEEAHSVAEIAGCPPLETVATPSSLISTSQIPSRKDDNNATISTIPSNADRGPKKVALLEDERWKQNIQTTLQQIQVENAKKKAEILREALCSKNVMLLASKPRRFEIENCLPKHVEIVNLDSELIKEADHPLPQDNVTPIFLKESFGEFGEESKPNIEEESGAAGLGLRCRPKYIDDERNGEIRAVLQRQQDIVRSNPTAVAEHLAMLLREDGTFVKESVAEVDTKSQAETKKSVPYDTVMSSFRELLCTRCMLYDCGLHGLTNAYSSELAAEVAMKKEESGFWKESTPSICLPVVSPLEDVTLSKDEQVIAEKLCFIYDNDVDKVALAMGVPKRSIQMQVSLSAVAFKHVKGNEDLSVFHSMMWEQKGRTSKLSAPARSSESQIMITPCHHTEPCSKETCGCVQNGHPCTNHCIWGPLSRNFFRGCNCQTECTTNLCPCFVAGRECDPDRCRSCQTCTDPAGQLQNRKQTCRNDNVTMRRHKHLLLAKSTLRNVGWGLFCKTELQRYEYIHEYIGEVITDGVAEVRSVQYVKENLSYLFDISSDYCVDGLRKCNKTRFMNHSSEPNVIAKVVLVKGDPHIAFFAKEHIPPQTELFFDYGNSFTFQSGSEEKKPSPKKRQERRSQR
eukprot:scaffold6238_cov106-Cylindrotheca_fusiformis.AAC.7